MEENSDHFDDDLDCEGVGDMCPRELALYMAELDCMRHWSHAEKIRFLGWRGNRELMYNTALFRHRLDKALPNNSVALRRRGGQVR